MGFLPILRFFGAIHKPFVRFLSPYLPISQESVKLMLEIYLMIRFCNFGGSILVPSFPPILLSSVKLTNNIFKIIIFEHSYQP